MMGPGEPGEVAYHVHSHPSKVEHWRHLLEIIALIIAAAWAFYVFVYQERIKPATQPVYVESSLAVSHQPIGADVEFINVALNFHNIGSTQADLAGVDANVFGYRFLSKTNLYTANYKKVPGWYDVYGTLGTTQPKLLHSFYRVWQPFGGYGKLHLDAGGTTQMSFWMGIHRGEYNVITVAYRYCFIRTGDERTYHATPVHHYRNAPYWLPDNFKNDLPSGERGYRCVLASNKFLQGFPL